MAVVCGDVRTVHI